MALYVQKFGGTSVGSVDRIKAVAEKVKGFRDQGHQVVVVVSAMSGETNRLTEMAHALNEDPAPREMDMLLSTAPTPRRVFSVLKLTISNLTWMQGRSWWSLVSKA